MTLDRTSGLDAWRSTLPGGDAGAPAGWGASSAPPGGPPDDPEAWDRFDRESDPRREAPADRAERSSWHMLLWLLIIVPMLTPIYNRVNPMLFGIPFFYWFQIMFIPLEIALITLVYQATKRRW